MRGLLLTAAVLAGSLAIFHASGWSASGESNMLSLQEHYAVSLTGGIDPQKIGGELAKGTYYTATMYEFLYDPAGRGDGAVILAGTEDGTGAFAVWDVLHLTVTHADGSTATLSLTSRPGRRTDRCAADTDLAPTDVTHLFEPGFNKVHVALKTFCESDFEYSTALWISTAVS